MSRRRWDGRGGLCPEHICIEGLATIAKRLETEGLLTSRVVRLQQQNGGDGKVTVETLSGKTHTFDFCIGADGMNSVVRCSLMFVRSRSRRTVLAVRLCRMRRCVSGPPGVGGRGREEDDGGVDGRERVYHHVSDL